MIPLRSLVLLLVALPAASVRTSNFDAKRAAKLRLSRVEGEYVLSLGDQRYVSGAAKRRIVRLDNGTLLAAEFANGAYSEFVHQPLDRAGTSRPVGAEFKNWLQDRMAFASDTERNAASSASIGSMTALVARGNDALAIVDWVNTAPSGTPTVFQHLVAIRDGAFRIVESLGAPATWPRGPGRLWDIRGRLILQSGRDLAEIDIHGKRLRRLATVPKAQAAKEEVAGKRWILFTPLTDPSVTEFNAFDTVTNRFIHVALPKGNGWDLTSIDPLSGELLFESGRSADERLIISLPDMSQLRFKFDLAGYLQLWNGLIVGRDPKGIVILSPHSGKVLRQFPLKDG